MVSNKNLIRLLVLLFCFSCFLSLDATMALSREIEFKNEKSDIVLEERNQISTNDQMEMEEVNLNGRFDFERDDYPYSGANNRHNPRNPGRP